MTTAEVCAAVGECGIQQRMLAFVSNCGHEVQKCIWREERIKSFVVITEVI